MLRQSLTFLRTRGLGSVLPLDQHIYLHKLTGWIIVCFGTLHTFMHIINFSESIYLVKKSFVNLKNNFRLLCGSRSCAECQKFHIERVVLHFTSRLLWIRQWLGKSNWFPSRCSFTHNVHLFAAFCSSGWKL